MVYCNEDLWGKTSCLSKVKWAQTNSLSIPVLLPCCSFQVKVAAFHPVTKESCEGRSPQALGKWELSRWRVLCSWWPWVPLPHRPMWSKTSLPVDVSDLSSCWLFFLRDLRRQRRNGHLSSWGLEFSCEPVIVLVDLFPDLECWCPLLGQKFARILPCCSDYCHFPFPLSSLH